uniref:Tetraspanin 34b n=1 Tax=Hippocampus comes TaxID=109280 RepID=A0A3Q2YF90_HIPCM
MGCFGFLKFMMFVFNGIIFLAGAVILGVGIWVKVDSGSILGFLGMIENAPAELGQVLNVGYLLIAVGVLLVIIGFLGCCGAIRESKCMLLLGMLLNLFIASHALTSTLYSSQAIPGCFEKFTQLINDNTVAIVAVALGIAALEVRTLLIEESDCCCFCFFKCNTRIKEVFISAERFYWAAQIKMMHIALKGVRFCPIHSAVNVLFSECSSLQVGYHLTSGVFKFWPGYLLFSQFLFKNKHCTGQLCAKAL